MQPGQIPLENPRQERFCQEYIVDRNGTQAYIRAGYAARSARVEASKALTNPNIRARITSLETEHLARAGMTAQDVIQRLVAIVQADPNELVRHRVGPCRHCHGRDHAYQWRSEAECADAERAHEAAPEATHAPDRHGGYGYRRSKAPHPDCPICEGDGDGYVVLRDTQQLSPTARHLYAGVRQTPLGPEIKMHDQMKALHQLAKCLGAFNKSLGAPGHPFADFIASISGSSAPIAEDI